MSNVEVSAQTKKIEKVYKAAKLNVMSERVLLNNLSTYIYKLICSYPYALRKQAWLRMHRCDLCRPLP